MEETRILWRLRDAGRFRFVSPQVVAGEIAEAPELVRELMRKSFTAEDLLENSQETEAWPKAIWRQGL